LCVLRKAVLLPRKCVLRKAVLLLRKEKLCLRK
jgi:hypothetical protein